MKKDARPLALPLVLLAACAGEPDPSPPAPDGAPRDAYAPWEGGRVHYVDAGGGADEALVLIHGWAGSVATWQHQVPVWPRLARTLAVDLPGHGASDPNPLPWTYPILADSVAAVLDHAGVERAVVVGHSNGTPVAASFARRHPGRTLAVVGIDGALRMLFRAEDVEAQVAPLYGDRWREAMSAMVRGMPGEGLDAADREAILAMALATPHEAVKGGLDAALDPGGWSEEPLGVPLLLVLAEQPTWNEAYEEAVRAMAPGVDYRVWPGASHYLHFEEPAELTATLHEFLAANGLLGF